MNPIVLQPLPKMKLGAFAILLDTSGRPGPPSELTDIAYSTNPMATLLRVRAEHGLESLPFEKA